MTALLHIVSCPIGNPDDITVRALAVLAQADIIAAEDTRQTKLLLSHHGLKSAGRLVSCHEHNEESRLQELIKSLRQGQSVALVTDAGTPTISDPGFPLVRAALEQQIKVVPVPGASAAITALTVSGLPTDSFVFAGFLPKKGNKRQERLTALSTERATLIFYESPHRLPRLLEELKQIMGERQAVVGREMTKPYEEFVRGTLSEISAILNDRATIKGEITVIVAGATVQRQQLSRDDIEQALKDSDCRPSELAKQLSLQSGRPKREIYEEILSLKKS